jgi:organic radical activating enzyme
MKLPHDQFCVLPWISLEASPIGTVRPCCLADDEIINNTGDKFYLSTATFSEIQNSDNMKQLRQEFLDGKKPQTCRKCWKEERAGRTSKRMFTIERLKHMLPDQDWTVDAKPLMFVDLKLGNICNLKCRICGSWSSSTFATEELANLAPDDDKKTNHHYQMLRQGAWPRENSQFWSEISDISDQIRYIEFTGGEPFMIQEHFDMLQGLVDRGLAHNIEIHYNTNGTQWPEQAEAIWKHFKIVEIAFSIDDVEGRFEYQRSGAVWSDVVTNMQRFRDLRSRNRNIRLQICCTINIFNVYYLETVANWIVQQQMDFIYWNMMHDAYFFSISSLPEKAKQGIAAKLQSAQVPPRVKEEFARVIDFMNNGVSLDGFQMRREIANLDRRREQNLAQVEPEFASLIDYANPDYPNG